MNMTYSASNRPIAAPRYPNAAPRYPNAAPRSLFWNKCADALLCGASTMGLVAAFFFLLTL